MTFEQFQNTKAWCSDIGELIQDARWNGEPPARGCVYLGCLYIEEVQDHWPEATKTRGKWHLILNRDEYVSNDLAALERKLYAFAVSEGYTLPPREDPDLYQRNRH